MIGVLALMPVAGFIAGYLFNGYDVSVAALSGLFGLGIMIATLVTLRKMFLKYFINKPAFILKDDAIETSSGNLVFWNWFDSAVVFKYRGYTLLGLRRKRDVQNSTIGESIADFNGVIFGFPFAIQFNQFATDEHELIKLFKTKLPVVVSNKKIELGDEIDWEKID